MSHEFKSSTYTWEERLVSANQSLSEARGLESEICSSIASSEAGCLEAEICQPIHKVRGLQAEVGYMIGSSEARDKEDDTDPPHALSEGRGLDKHDGPPLPRS